MSEAAEAIVASGVRYRYGQKQVLRGADLVVPAGEAVLLAGRNGSGKSTLLRILAGFDRPSAGTIRIAGYDLSRQASQARRVVGYVPETPTFDAELTIREILTFHAHCAGLGGATARGAVEAMLQLVDLFDLRQRPPGELSRGQGQRLAIARALIHDPGLILLDEPLVALDAPGQAELLEVLYELKALGKTLVVATQAPSLLADWADRLALLADGVLAAGPIDQFRVAGSAGRVVHVVVLDGADVAAELLASHSAVAELQRDSEDPGGSGTHLRFILRHAPDSGPVALATLVRDLVERGVAIVEIYGEAPSLVEVA